MRFALIVMLDTERSPQNVMGEIVSHLEFEPVTQTTVLSVAVFNDDGEEVAVYDRKEKKK